MVAAENSDSDSVASLRKAYKADENDEKVLSELLVVLSKDGATRSEARNYCQRYLSVNPTNAIIRLWLARLYYLDKLGEFCVRELVELQKYSEAPSINKLLSAFGSFAEPFLRAPVEDEEVLQVLPSGNTTDKSVDNKKDSDAKVVAELDFDADFDELLADFD